MIVEHTRVMAALCGRRGALQNAAADPRCEKQPRSAAALVSNASKGERKLTQTRGKQCGW